MPGFTFQDMQKMQDEAAASLVDDLVPDFLSLFESGKPLQRDAIDDWRLLRLIKVDRIKNAANEALKFGWIIDTPDGMFITPEGTKKAEEG